MSMFKKCSVVMLSTNEKASPIFIGKRDNKLHYFFKGNKPNNAIFQHIYILSDDEIKEGDWCIHLKYNEIHKAVHDNHFEFEKGDCKKIIATTDSSLTRVVESFKGEVIEERVPQPSQAFIKKYVEEYNKGNVITEVMVEYNDTTNNEFPAFDSPIWLKINPKDNTITIKKVKDSYSREEVVNLIKEVWFQSQELEETVDEWIEENL